MEQNGHDVIVFSMENEKNYYSRFENYFVKSIDYNDNKSFKKIKNGLKVIYSAEAYKKLTQLIKDTKPDIAHVNMFCHQLTPSIFYALKKGGIPVVYTSHNYKLVCPNYKLLSHNNVCKKCIKGSYRHCLANSCHKDSRAASGIVTLEAYIYRLLNTYRIMGRIICPSKFMYDTLKEAGYREDRLVMLHNFLSRDIFSTGASLVKRNKNNTILYFGRLSDEKGIDTLLDARKKIPGEVKIKFIGTGPMEAYIKDRIEKEGLENIELAGFVSGQPLYDEISLAKCTVISSKWYEVFGLTIIESFAVGTPVIGSDIGGISELIKPGRTGYLFETGNAEELSLCINMLLSLDEENYEVMVHNCISESFKYSPDTYYNKLMNVYGEVVKQKTDALEII